MKAKDGVVEFIIQVLKAELTAVHQYLLHAAMCKNWGYERLHEHFSHLANEEVSHSSGLIDHILYLDGTPDVQHLDQVAAGRTVEDLFKADLNFEREDVELLRKAIAHCAKVGDYTTRHLLEHMVIDSEEHVDWFETQLRTIDQVGLDLYLSEHIKK
ncbi:MAG TPA: bacterioferritin [Nitrospiraceae bacterium]|nr:bacterioferritin [Nitrospiraceae bacterium]